MIKLHVTYLLEMACLHPVTTLVRVSGLHSITHFLSQPWCLGSVGNDEEWRLSWRRKVFTKNFGVAASKLDTVKEADWKGVDVLVLERDCKGFFLKETASDDKAAAVKAYT